jgi:rhamnosyltransferase
VVVTYHPEAGQAERVAAIVDQVEAVLIVDNGSSPQELEQLRPLLEDGRVSLLANGRNLGVGEALEQGMRWADDRGFAWVVTLDQDSMALPDLLEEASRAWDSFRDRRLAVIGAGRTDPASREGGATIVPAVITSGAVHDVAAWRDLRGFATDFFIDYVDIEFCLRARAHGYAVALVGRKTLQHQIGRSSMHPLVPGRRATATNHSPLRRYYITRNRVIVWRRYWETDRRYVLGDLRAAGRELVKVACFERQRPAKFIEMLRGVRDGLGGKTGVRSGSLLV